MLKETKEITDFILNKVIEMQTKHPNGMKVDWNPDEIDQMTRMNLAISVFGATQFYTIERPFISEEKAKEGLDLFLEDVKKEALNMIDAKEEQRRKEKEKIQNGEGLC
jgi:hypothetical protein